MTSRLHAQVLVVGGGPVGMLVAAELGAYGVRTLVLEAEAAVSERPKATTLHARALQCLVRRGYLAELVSTPIDAEASFHFAGIPGLSITAPVSEPGPLLKRPQAELERMFEQRSRAVGVRILREHRVTEVTQDRDGVQVLAEGAAGAVVCRAQYLVGADGARSMVREQTGVPSQTSPATASGMAGLVRLRDPQTLRPGWHRTPRGWITAHPAPHLGTHIRTLNCSGAHSRRQQPPTLEELHSEISWIAGQDIEMAEPRWLSRFSDFSRLVGSYRQGRVFLAGDAAHVHFPIGGQGLSTGVQDAVNLGWKLALAVRGVAGESLLDTYDRERRPAAQRVIDNTRAQLALMRPDRELDALRGLFTGLLEVGGAAEHLSALISAQETVLPGHIRSSSSWAGRFLQNTGLTTAAEETDVIGLLRDGRPVLLLFGERGSRYAEEARPWAGILRVVHALPADDVPCEALLVRPDGYIAWAPGGAALATVLSAYFGESARRTAGSAPSGEGLAEALS